MTESDRLWVQDGIRNRWEIKRKALWPLRLWGIRHLRAAILSYQVERAAFEFGRAGIGLGTPNQRDLWVIYAVARGWA